MKAKNTGEGVLGSAAANSGLGQASLVPILLSLLAVASIVVVVLGVAVVVTVARRRRHDDKSPTTSASSLTPKQLPVADGRRNST